MREKLGKLLHADITGFFIYPFSEMEALSIQFAFIVGFFEYILRREAASNFSYLLDGDSSFLPAIGLGYTLYLTYLVSLDRILSQTEKYIVGLVMNLLLSFVIVINAVTVFPTLDLKHGLAIYELYTYAFSLFFFIPAAMRFFIIFGSLRNAGEDWGGLTKKDIASKMYDDQMNTVQFLVAIIFPIILYIFFRSYNSISFSILQAYFFTTLLVNLLKRPVNLRG